MKLHIKSLTALAEMICGNDDSDFGSYFRYRTGGQLYDFFEACDLEAHHVGGGTRKWVTRDTLVKLNGLTQSHPNLPPDAIVCVIQELMLEEYFGEPALDRDAALEDLNRALARDSLRVVPTADGKVQVQHVASGVVSGNVEPIRRALTAAEIKRRKELDEHLRSLSEDAFTETILVPILQNLRFMRVSVAGHRDKALEYGKDLWMKSVLPTGHWLYFGLQVKIGKVDSAGRSQANVAELLNQTKMMLGHEIFDPELNRRVLVDHVFLVSSGEITKAARNWLGQNLDSDKRRSVMFIDRKDILDLAIQSTAHLEGFDPDPAGVSTDDFGF